MSEAAKSLAGYFRFYNQERIHQSLGRQTPAEVYFGDREARGGLEAAVDAATPVALRAPSVAASEDHFHLKSHQQWS